MELDLKYTITHFILGVFYGIIFVLCIIWRPTASKSDAQRKNRFWRDLFTFLLLNGALIRGIWQVSQPFWYSYYINLPPTINIYFNVIPSFFFMGNYLLILFFWMEVYYSYGTNLVDLKNWFMTIFGFVFLIITFLILFDIWYYPVPRHQKVPRFNESFTRHFMINFLGCCYLIISVCFLYYGIRLYWRFRKVKQRELIHRVRSIILPRVKILTSLCWSCFILRSALVIWNATADFYSVTGQVDPWPDDWYWWIDIVYYTLLELMPLFFMLLIFKSPETKESSSIRIVSN